MGTILPKDITPSVASNIEQFSKKVAIRVKAFEASDTGNVHSTNPVGDGFYNVSTGIYTIPINEWFISVLMMGSGTRTICKVEYEDVNGNFITIGTIEGTTFVSKIAIYAKRFRFSMYKKTDPNDTEFPSLVFVRFDRYAEIQNLLSGGIMIENNTDHFKGEILLPHIRIGLNNSSGIWNKSIVGPTMKSYIYTKNGHEETGNVYLTYVKKRGTRITIEIKYFGSDWEDSDWILLCSFYIRKISSTEMSGEAGWMAKTSIETPILEGDSPQNIIEKYIIRDQNRILLQINKDVKDEVITIERDVVGETELEDAFPYDILGGETIACHANYGGYIYYAVQQIGNNGLDSGRVDIYKIPESGEGEPIPIGSIFAVPAEYMHATWDRTIIGWPEPIGIESYWLDASPNINNNASFSRMVRLVGGMAVDGTYVYISLLNVMNVVYYNEEVVPATCGGWTFETCIYKLPVDGTGWDVVGQTKFQDEKWCNISIYPNPYLLSYKKSDGYGGAANYGEPYVTDDAYDVVDGGGNKVPTYRSLMLFDDGGTEKILVIKEIRRNSIIAVNSEFWVMTKDLTTITKINNAPTGLRVEAICNYNDGFNMYVHYTDFTESKKYIAPLELIGGVWTIQTSRRAEIVDRFRGMSVFGDGIFASGDRFDGNDGYFPTSEGISDRGIILKYKNSFTLDGINISHFKHPIYNKYISNPVPLIEVDGIDRTKDFCRFEEDRIYGDVYRTPVFVLDLHTGRLTLREIFPTDKQISASYDFISSFLFYSASAKSRLGTDCLGKLCEAINRSYYLNEAGILEKLTGKVTQVIPIRHRLSSYEDVVDEGTETTLGLLTKAGAGIPQINESRMICYEFQPQHTGILTSFKIPIRLNQYANLIGGEDVPIRIRIYMGDVGVHDGVDLRAETAWFIYDPPWSTDHPISYSVELLDTTFSIKKKLATIWKDEYRWISFDVSAANIQVKKGIKYAVCFRVYQPSPTRVTTYDYEILAKKVAVKADNKIATNFFYAGDEFIGADTEAFEEYYSPQLGQFVHAVGLMHVDIRKNEIELDSTKIIDSLNPIITDSFSTLEGGSNTSISVYSDDYLTKYTRPAQYNIIYSGGKFYIQLVGIQFPIDKTILVSWYETDDDILLITERNRLDSNIYQGDDTIYLKASIKGLKTLPSTNPVVIDKDYEVFPGENLDIKTSHVQTRESEPALTKRWNEVTSQFEVVSDKSNKFAFELDDPFVTGWTAYSVRYGKGKTATDHVESKSYTVPVSHGIPIFYKFTLSTAFPHESYHVMFKDDQNKSWRMAVDDDRSDMINNTWDVTAGSWVDPSPSLPLQGTNYYHVKHMNSYYGHTTVNMIIYEAADRLFYIDNNGTVIEDSTFRPESLTNPIRSAHISKSIIVRITPHDFVGNPLFEYHNEPSVNGRDTSYHANIVASMSMKIVRADVSASGINAMFSRWGTKKGFVKIEVLGYPINNVSEIYVEKSKPGAEHADSQVISIDNDLIQHYSLAYRRVMDLVAFWSIDRGIYDRTVVEDPRIRPGKIVSITSQSEGYSKSLFYIHTCRHAIQLISGGSSGSLSIAIPYLLQI